MSLPRHVLMTTDTVGGVWSWSVQWAKILSEHGVRVTLAAWGNPPEPLHMRDVELVIAHYKLEWMEDPWADIDAAGQWLLDLADERRPDVIHLNDFSHGSLPFHAPKVVVAHSDVVSWWSAVAGGAPPMKWNTYRRRVRAGLLGADQTVAVSGALADSVATAYGVDRPRVIYNSRDAAAFRPGTKRDLIFSSGRVWDEAKNMRTLDRASAGLPWMVCIAGSLESPEGQKAQLDHAQMLGTQSEERMREWFRAASIYALPARYEPFGLSVLEAALAGCALVLGDIPSMRELWNGCALFVDPADVEGLRATLLSLIESPGKMRELAATGRERALTFSPDRMLRAWLETYAEASERFGRAGDRASCSW